jgi:hypothetical protein
MTAAKTIEEREGLRNILASSSISALNLQQVQMGCSAVQAGAGDACFSAVSE